MVREYTLRIVPPSPIYEEILDFKSQFKNIFGKQIYSNSKPHITLAVFLMDAENQEELINILNSLSSEKKFCLEITGFEIFENALVLLLGIKESAELLTLSQVLKSLFKNSLESLIIKGKLRFSNSPHITISKTEDNIMLSTSYQAFKNVLYQKEFKVDNLILTSRLPYKTWDWEHKIELKQE